MLVDSLFSFPSFTSEIRKSARILRQTELRRDGTLARLKAWPEHRRSADLQVSRLGHYADLKVGATKSAERSQNVYENKGAARKSTTPDPSLSKEGDSRAPLLGRGGVGGGGTLRPWRPLRIGVKPGL